MDKRLKWVISLMPAVGLFALMSVAFGNYTMDGMDRPPGQMHKWSIRANGEGWPELERKKRTTAFFPTARAFKNKTARDYFVYVSPEVIADVLDAEVKYEHVEQVRVSPTRKSWREKVTLKVRDKTVTLIEGKNFGFFNGRKVSLPSVGFWLHGTGSPWYVMAKPVVEHLGGSVRIGRGKNLIDIHSSGTRTTGDRRSRGEQQPIQVINSVRNATIDLGGRDDVKIRDINIDAKGETISGEFIWEKRTLNNPGEIDQIFIAVERKIVEVVYNGIPGSSGIRERARISFSYNWRPGRSYDVYVVMTPATSIKHGKRHYEVEGGGHRTRIASIKCR